MSRLSYAGFLSYPLCGNKSDKKRLELLSIPVDPITPRVPLKGHMRAALIRFRRRKMRRLIGFYSTWHFHWAYMGVTPLYIIFKALIVCFLMPCMPLVFVSLKAWLNEEVTSIYIDLNLNLFTCSFFGK